MMGPEFRVGDVGEVSDNKGLWLDVKEIEREWVKVNE
jgi:hypothetical protein